MPAHAFADVDYSRTINLAGKQRMLTQKMAKEALLVSMDIDKEMNLRKLKNTHFLFDKTLKGLKTGDKALGLEPVTNVEIQRQLVTVEELWEEYGAAIEGIVLDGVASEIQVDTIAELSLPILQEMNKAVQIYETLASDGNLSPELAAAINVSGRQRMLTQKMSKEFLLIANEKDVEANKTNLQKTIELFDTSLKGLTDGDDSMGLAPAPNDELKTQLGKVSAVWTTFRPVIEGEATAENVQTVSSENLSLLNEAKAVVTMYERARPVGDSQ